VSTCAKKIEVAISAKQIPHFGKSDLGFLDILFLFFSQGEEATHVSSHVSEEEEKQVARVASIQYVQVTSAVYTGDINSMYSSYR
jgi:hypothetical protein